MKFNWFFLFKLSVANTEERTLSKSVFELISAMETSGKKNYTDELKAVLSIIRKK